MIVNRVRLKLCFNPFVQAQGCDTLYVARTWSKGKAIKCLSYLSSAVPLRSMATAAGGEQREK
jgi:hypothetical protein